MLALQLLFDWIWVNIPPYPLILPFDLYLGGWGMTMNTQGIVCAQLVLLKVWFLDRLYQHLLRCKLEMQIHEPRTH